MRRGGTRRSIGCRWREDEGVLGADVAVGQDECVVGLEFRFRLSNDRG
jgi:hypothetical protein